MGHRVRTRWQLKYDDLEFGVVTSSEGLEAWLRPENYKVGGNGSRSRAGAEEGTWGREGLTGCQALLDSCPLSPAPAPAGRLSPDLSCGRRGTTEHRSPDMPVPAEPCGPMWPGELSGLERAVLKSENQTLLFWEGS